MGRVDGLFLGDSIVGSTYDITNGFVDEICENVSEDSVTSNVIFSTEKNVINSSNQLLSQIALAYRSLCEMKKKAREHKRIYEIICSNREVCSYAIVGLESSDTAIEMSQTMEIDNAEDRNLLALDYFLSVYDEQFHGEQEVENLTALIDQYRTDVLCGYEENLLDKKYEPLVEGIKNLQNNSDEMTFEFAERSVEISLTPIRKMILQELAKEYLIRIQTLANNMSANFGLNDCVYLYTDIPDFSLKYKKELEEIASKNHVLIESFDDRKKAIAQGNAYYFYLINALFKERIKEKIGGVSILYNGNEYVLSEFQGEILLTIENDFQISPELKVMDRLSSSTGEWRVKAPFFKSGDQLMINYSFEQDRVQLHACHLISGEQSSYTLMFRK